jgi:hypothetical protein
MSIALVESHSVTVRQSQDKPSDSISKLLDAPPPFLHLQHSVRTLPSIPQNIRPSSTTSSHFANQIDCHSSNKTLRA